ncbi:outer membrane beta-barrel protein [Cysteiniphilum sp. QT6929]|uniref:outer membrane beta-barrel protein n=1 Tax=Cysteiniphilum sp. QT6929 TaxID=2975055 RepID=UPI0024B34879|nr:outer membrane beta-barrel protein [Cysteiniphilum sp. QT6929]WHN65098.1 porin family protein [Cysteiniphilum sp. QT6929]
MKKILITSLILSTPILVVANEYQATAQSGLILGVEGGYGQITGSLWDQSSGLDKKSGGAIGSLDIGGQYALNPWLALGVQTSVMYGHKLLSYGDDDIDYKATFILPVQLTAQVVLPMGLNFLAGAGMAYVAQRVTYLMGKNQDDELGKKWNPITSIGIGYQVAPRFNIFAKYQYIWGKKDKAVLPQAGENYTNPIQALTLGVSYIFGA